VGFTHGMECPAESAQSAGIIPCHFIVWCATAEIQYLNQFMFKKNGFSSTLTWYVSILFGSPRRTGPSFLKIKKKAKNLD